MLGTAFYFKYDVISVELDVNTNSVFEIYQVNFIVSDSGAHVLNSWTQEDQNLQEVWLGFELWPFLKII